MAKNFKAILLLLVLLVGSRHAEADASFDHPSEEPMMFFDGYNGGNCEGCEWIVAEGVFIKGTADRFEKFLTEKYHTPEAAYAREVRFNSPGGSVVEAIRVGDLIRKWGLSTGVGKTVGVLREWGSVYSEETVAGECASACAYAVLGGVKRFLLGGKRIGVHQHYAEASFAEPLAQTATAIDRSIDQIITGLILEYVIRMGVDPRFVTKAEAVPPWASIYWLSEREITDFGLDNTTDAYSSPKLIAIGSKGAAIEIEHIRGYRANQKHPTRYRLFCRGKAHAPHLAVIMHEKAASPSFRSQVAQKIDFTIKDRNGAETLVRPLLEEVSEKSSEDGTFILATAWSLPSLNVDTLATASSITAVDSPTGGVPHVYFSTQDVLRFEIAAADKLMQLAFRNCAE